MNDRMPRIVPVISQEQHFGVNLMNRFTHYKTAMLLLGLVSIISTTGCGKTGDAKPEQSKETVVAQHAEPDNKKPRAEKSAVPNGEHGDEARLKLSAEEIQTAGIKVAELRLEAVTEQITATATIQANQDKLAHVSSRVSGKVVKVFSNLGDQVKQGQTLALIDSIEVGEAQSAYTQAESEHAVAKANFERSEKLYAEQIVPQKDYLRVKAEYEKSRAVLRAVKEKRQMLGVDGAHSNASSIYPIVAPFSGTVIDKKAVLGELAQPDKPLFGVADLSIVWIETNLFEKDLGKVSMGAEALVSVAAYPNEVFKGRMTYLSSVMDKETRTVKARVEVPNRDGRLKLEMFANAAINTTAKNNAMLVPEEAVLLVQGQPTVFVQEHEDFEPRAVDLGEKLHGRVILKAGIKPGEKVVTRGSYALKAKMLKSQIGDAH